MGVHVLTLHHQMGDHTMKDAIAKPAATHVNGLEILAQVATPSGSGLGKGRVILVHEGAGEVEHLTGGEYIVAWQGYGELGWDDGWHQGWYLRCSYKNALKQFWKRVDRTLYLDNDA